MRWTGLCSSKRKGEKEEAPTGSNEVRQQTDVVVSKGWIDRDKAGVFERRVEAPGGRLPEGEEVGLSCVDVEVPVQSGVTQRVHSARREVDRNDLVAMLREQKSVMATSRAGNEDAPWRSQQAEPKGGVEHRRRTTKIPSCFTL